MPAAIYWRHADNSVGGIEAVPINPVTLAEVDPSLFIPAGVTRITKEEFLGGAGSTTTTSTSGSLTPTTFGKLINAASDAPGSIIKTSTALTALDSGGWGAKAALADGAMSVPANTSIHYAFGWLPDTNAADTVIDWKKLAHCLYFYGNGYSVYEFGASKFSGVFAVNDLFLVTLIGSTVMYTQNSKMVFTSVRNKTGLLPAVMIKTPGIKLININHFIKE